jgi:hypothetical protein
MLKFYPTTSKLQPSVGFLKSDYPKRDNRQGKLVEIYLVFSLLLENDGN